MRNISACKRTAEVLGKDEEAKKYAELYETTLDAFRREYYTETGRIVSETQTGAIISLYFNLAREKDRKRILNTLLTNIGNHKNHLATGFFAPYNFITILKMEHMRWQRHSS